MSNVRVPPRLTELLLIVTPEFASLEFAMLPASCALVTEILETLLLQSAPAVALAAIPSSLVFSVAVNSLLVVPSAILSALIAALFDMSALTIAVPVAR